MLYDSTLMFSDDQAITASAVSTNVLDFGAVDTPKHAAAALARDMGKGNEAEIRIQVTEDFATLTSLTVKLQGSVDEAFSSPVDLQTTVAVAAADLVAGKVFSIDDFEIGSTYRYYRLSYVVAGSDATAGKVHAGIVFEGDERW